MYFVNNSQENHKISDKWEDVRALLQILIPFQNTSATVSLDQWNLQLIPDQVLGLECIALKLKSKRTCMDSWERRMKY